MRFKNPQVDLSDAISNDISETKFSLRGEESKINIATHRLFLKSQLKVDCFYIYTYFWRFL